MQRSVWTLGVMPRDDVWGEAADEESLLEPRRQNFRGRTFRPPISMMFVALFLVVASVTVMRICLGGHRHVHIDAIIVKAAASSSQTCEGYDATAGCDWTLEWSCPGQRRGTSGVAGEEDADSLGYKCCCGAELWRQMPTNSSSTSNVRLFCFSLMWTSGDEPDLLKFQVEHGASIFACDFTSVYNGGSDSVDLGKGPNGQVMTKCISDMPLPHEKGTYGAVVDGITQTTSSWLSVPTWLRIWEEVRDEGFYKQADWTVKVDPDAVFLPERLRQHLLPYSSAKPLYIHNQNCFADEFHFSGSLEALSRGAMDTYMDGYPRCKDELPWQGWSEDYYMEYCLDLLQVNHEDDFEVLSDQFGCRFSAPGCTEDNWAAFHPFKDVKTYSECYANAMQAAGAAPATAAPAQPPQQALTAAASAEPPPSAPPPPKPAAAQEASPPPEGLPEGPSPQSAGEQPPPPVAEAAGEDAAVVPEQAVQGFKQPPAAAAEDAGVTPRWSQSRRCKASSSHQLRQGKMRGWSPIRRCKPSSSRPRRRTETPRWSQSRRCKASSSHRLRQGKMRGWSPIRRCKPSSSRPRRRTKTPRWSQSRRCKASSSQGFPRTPRALGVPRRRAKTPRWSPSRRCRASSSLSWRQAETRGGSLGRRRRPRLIRWTRRP
ncbi:unnamed protein product [Prorocentrum cordatum]|uniref:Nucleotide-diphospho-sugar transferase domain-containing protein n=1 Tax=Prorocentrum cordatum TaxID=2364126 RepID=A0ABN9W3W5_9DINO|nr:unnamed protein product [Polarella glacialis]